jgi:hypothetical protein
MSMVMSHALVEIMTRRGMSREDIIEELRSIPHRQVGGRPDLEGIAPNVVAALIAWIDRRSVSPAGRA